MEEENEIKGKIKFYQNELYILFPNNFEDFQELLGEIFGLQGDFISNFTLTYTGENGEIEIEKTLDYKKFYSYASEQNILIVLNIQVNELSNIDIQKCTANLLSYKAKNSDNIQSVNLNEEENNNKNNLNIINEDEKLINQHNNNLILNNNIIDDNNIVSNNLGQNNNLDLRVLVYPVACFICKGFPLFQSLYYCLQCNKVFCFHCEVQEGPKHKHAYYKVQTKEQYEGVRDIGMSKFDKFMESVGNSMGNAFDSVMSFFSKKNGPKAKRTSEAQLVSLVEITKYLYDLKNVPDQTIEDALRKTNGNIDEAVLLLTTQDNQI